MKHLGFFFLSGVVIIGVDEFWPYLGMLVWGVMFFALVPLFLPVLGEQN